MRTTLLAVALAGAAIALAAPTANAARADVWAGPPGAKAPAGLPHQGDANEFFPKAITIAQGDRLSWRSATFHTVTFPVLDEYPPAFAGLALDSPISGVRDAAGLPFYFDGLPNLIVNPGVATPTSGPTYDGRQQRNSGILIGPKSQRYDLKFTTRGTFTYYCVVHPGMKGTVTVKPKGSKVPTAKANQRRVRSQIAAWVADNKRDARVTPPSGTVLAGSDHGTHVLQRFFPARSDVKVADSLTFKMTPGTSEAHTVTFGPGQYLADLARDYVLPGGLLSPVANYPSDMGALVLTGRNHGNGFLNTGLLDDDVATPLDSKATVTFAKRGTYPYICLLHPGMVGEVVVH